MGTIRDKQEETRAVLDLISEIKDDVETVEQCGEEQNRSLLLFDLYQKLDDLADLVEELTKLSITIEI